MNHLVAMGRYILEISFNYKTSKPISALSLRDDIWVFTRGQFWPLRIVVACVFLCVCPSVCVSANPELVCTISYHSFKLEPPNLDKTQDCDIWDLRTCAACYLTHLPWYFKTPEYRWNCRATYGIVDRRPNYRNWEYYSFICIKSPQQCMLHPITVQKCIRL